MHFVGLALETEAIVTAGLRASIGPQLSFGKSITFQHVGGASPASAHAQLVINTGEML